MAFFYEPDMLPQSQDIKSSVSSRTMLSQHEIADLDRLENLLNANIEAVANQSAPVPIGLHGRDAEERMECEESTKLDGTHDMEDVEDSSLSSMDNNEDSEVG